MSAGIDGVLLIAFGGPTAPEEVRPFLAEVARGRGIPSERLEEVADHYARMPGGRSPLTELTRRQASAAESMLASLGRRLPVRVGMRHWHPYLHETLAEMASAGVRRALGIILSPLRSEASWERYMKDVEAARGRLPAAPEVVFGPPWFDHPGFVAALADRVQRALAEVPAAARAATPVVFTAHSVPVSMAAASPYAADFTAAARAVAARAGVAQWSLAYQSRSGRPDEPWLEPDVNDVLRQLARAGAREVVVAPLGFVVDHVEVLYDLDVAAQETARSLGIAWHRAAAVNDHPQFIRTIVELVARVAEAPPPDRASIPSPAAGS